MINNVIPLSTFTNSYKRFNKKFPTLRNEVLELESLLLKEPKTGTNLGGNLYKIRLASKDKNTGKSGGFRVITYLVEETSIATNIYLLKIYDKSEESSITKTILLKLIKSIFG